MVTRNSNTGQGSDRVRDARTAQCPHCPAAGQCHPQASVLSAVTGVSLPGGSAGKPDPVRALRPAAARGAAVWRHTPTRVYLCHISLNARAYNECQYIRNVNGSSTVREVIVGQLPSATASTSTPRMATHTSGPVSDIRTVDANGASHSQDLVHTMPQRQPLRESHDLVGRFVLDSLADRSDRRAEVRREERALVRE